MAATNAAKAAAAKNDVIADSKELVTDVVDLVEDTVELVKKSWLTRNPHTVVAITAMVAAGLGVSAGYFLANKRLSSKWQKIADEQVSQVKESYSLRRKDNVSLEELAAKYDDDESQQEADLAVTKEISDSAGYTNYHRVTPVVEDPIVVEDIVEEPVEVVEAEVIQQNVFDSDPTYFFDYEKEIAWREANPNLPCVISFDEYDNNESEFTQTSMIYYAGDNVVADFSDKDVPHTTIGDYNLDRFGYGSKDPNTVFIRNPVLELDIELVHDDGKYSVEILGFDDNLAHSDRRPMRKFRNYDE